MKLTSLSRFPHCTMAPVYCRKILLFIAISSTGNVSMPSNALAADLSRLNTEISDLEQQAKSLSVRYRNDPVAQDKLAEHRLVDAQVLFTLRDYTRAAIVLMDYVQRFRSTAGYPEALYYLAESLYQKRDFLSARRYFREIAYQVRGPYHQEAMQRLVELALRTGDKSDVSRCLDVLSAIPADQLKPTVPYVRGKYHYFQGELAEALRAFAVIPSGSPYYFHGQYFSGAIMVQKKDYANAMQRFQQLLRVNVKGSGDSAVRELTYLALGRLLYEKGRIAEAIDQYQKVSRKSAVFDTALYEIAWAYIKAGQFQKALRALELLVLAKPESPEMPEVRVLQGNLHIRLNQWGKATDIFSKTRDQFAPAHQQLQSILQGQRSPTAFFDAILNENRGQMSVQFPPLSVQWVSQIPKVKRAVAVVRDVRDIALNLTEVKELISRLERVINSPAKIKIFPEFAAARTSAVEVENRLALARQKILSLEHQLIEQVANGSERDRLASLAGSRGAIELKIKQLPTSVNDYVGREKIKVERLSTMERQLNELSVMVQNMRAQLVASEKYFADTQSKVSAEVRASFRTELGEVQTIVSGLQSEVEEVGTMLADAKQTAGIGGPEELAEQGLKNQYREAVRQEHQYLDSLKSRLSGADQSLFASLSNLLDRADQTDVTVSSFNKHLDEGVEQKLISVREIINEERAMLGQYDGEIGQCQAGSDDVAGSIAFEGFHDVSQRFYENVVRADVGIIDVAWALKDAKSKEVSRYVKQQKLDLKLLDDEFQAVLKDD